MFKSILEENLQAEIVEKKSKFIANIFYVETVEEAEAKIKEVKKKYFDAKHNCFAFSVHTKEGGVNRFSDDGEPSGTAGAPMLNILNSKNLCNILVVVTRYFGGILLGTGGLVRAYTLALQETLKKGTIVTKTLGNIVNIDIEYNQLENIKYYLRNNNINIADTKFSDIIRLKVEITDEELEEISNKVAEKELSVIKLEKVDTKYISK